MNKRKWTCPRCKNIAVGYGATSRRDNKTKICSNCGTSEALFDWKVSESKRKGEPVSDQEIQEERAWMEA